MPGRCSSEANDTPQSTIDPLPAALVAEAVDREIHPDLADAAERREDQFVLRHPGSLARRDRKDVAGRDRLQRAVGEAQQQAGRVRRAPRRGRQIRDLAAAPASRRRCPRHGRASRREWPEILRRDRHCASRRAIAPDSAPNKIFGGDRRAGRREIGRRISGFHRVMHAIHADADGDGKSRASTVSPSIKMPASICPPQRTSFGHFSVSFSAQRGGAIDDRVMNGKRRDERQLRRVFGRRRIDKAAAWRRDCRAAKSMRCRAGRGPRSAAAP